MDIRKEDLPVTLQAFELQDNNEIFVAEQVVTNQVDVDRFTTMYAGKIIKAKKDTVAHRSSGGNTMITKKRNPAVGIFMIVLILVLVALVIYGFSTGWIQQKFNLNI
jgi:hypothetical protein